jgi:hypothetical protein
MSKAIAFTRTRAVDSVEALRFVIVVACGCALIAAGQFLPL